MRLRTLFVIVIIVLIAGFATINWPVFMAPTPLNLLFTTVEAPLGLVMLAMLVVVFLIFVVYMAVWQAKVLVDSRRHTTELQRQRVLADEAEASRFTELRTQLRDEMANLNVRISDGNEALRREIRDHSNSLAANVAEMDDRMKRGGPTDPVPVLP